MEKLPQEVEQKGGGWGDTLDFHQGPDLVRQGVNHNHMYEHSRKRANVLDIAC